VYYEEQQLKAEDEKRLAWEADSIGGYEKTIPGLHPKPEGEPPECFCGDICKM
jgi:hypothetical protein